MIRPEHVKVLPEVRILFEKEQDGWTRGTQMQTSKKCFLACNELCMHTKTRNWPLTENSTKLQCLSKLSPHALWMDKMNPKSVCDMLNDALHLRRQWIDVLEVGFLKIKPCDRICKSRVGSQIFNNIYRCSSWYSSLFQPLDGETALPLINPVINLSFYYYSTDFNQTSSLKSHLPLLMDIFLAVSP